MFAIPTVAWLVRKPWQAPNHDRRSITVGVVGMAYYPSAGFECRGRYALFRLCVVQGRGNQDWHGVCGKQLKK